MLTQERFNSENLQVGDKVVVKELYWGKSTEYIGIIKKITPTRLLDVGYRGVTVRFRPNGTPFNKSNPYSRDTVALFNYTENREKAIRQGEDKEKMVKHLKGINWDSYTYEQLFMIMQELDCILI